MIDPLMQAEAMIWMWCSLMHRKHHIHSTNEFLCTNYRDCGKCGSYVVSRNRKLERAKEQRDFARQRELVRKVYAPDLANTVGDNKFNKRSPLVSLPTLDSLEWPDEIE